MPSRKFEYRGDLSSLPLPEILATIHRYRVPGVVSVSRDGRVRRVFVDDGLVIFAASNEREAGLAAFLLKKGVLDAETALEAQERRSRDGLRLGQVLLQMGILTPERLNAAIAGQTRDIVIGAFDWDAGEAVFEVGVRRSDSVRVDLPIPGLIVEGIRAAANVKRLVQRLGSAQSVLEKVPGAQLSLFSAPEQSFFQEVDGKTPLQKLSARGPASQTENVRLLYAFFCLGLLHKKRAVSSGAKKIQYKTEGGRLGSD